MSFQMVLLPGLTIKHTRKRFWNYVIPDGSTTRLARLPSVKKFWNYVIPDGSTTGSVLPEMRQGFGTMSFQMVLLLVGQYNIRV